MSPGNRHWKGWRHTLGHSIQGRLTALFIGLALGTSCVFLFGMQRVVEDGWQTYAKPLVADYLDRLAAEIGSPPDIAKAQALVEGLPITLRIDGPQVQWDSQPGSRRRHRDAGADEPEASERWGSWGLVRRTADGHRIRFGLARAPDVTRPRVVGWLTLAALLLLTGFAYASVRRLLSPLGPIAAGVAAYGRGAFDRPIPALRSDEFGALAERINGMAANLGSMLDAKRALLLAISHELRSPLTRARINAELVEEGAPRDALLRDLGQMRDLITDLLESERLAQGHAALQPERCDLPALIRDVVTTQFKDAALTLELAATGEPVAVDATRMRLLMRNLIDNALRHSAAADMPPVVFLRREGEGPLAMVALGVRDHGPGLSEEQIARLGQAFYRPDSARSRDAGGIGLGLYLCRLVARAHGGELRIKAAAPGLEVSAVFRPSSA